MKNMLRPPECKIKGGAGFQGEYKVRPYGLNKQGYYSGN